MSELKVYHHELRHNEYEEFYLKYEADKVIADRDEEIAKLKSEIERLEILCANYRHDCDNLAISNEKAKRAARTLLKKMNHNKYKRCLAMAEWCNSEMGRETFACFRPRHTKEVWKEEHKYWAKWRKIWFELYKKFKEAK